MNILLVDDDPTVRDFVMIVLARDGHSVVAVHDGRDALEAFAVGRFDLVLSDVAMPGLDGLGLAKALLEMDSSQQVILISGDGDGIQKPSNVKVVLHKPIRFAELTSTIQEMAA